MSELPRKQRKPSVGKNGVPTPPGFEAHPERRHNGAWKKEDTPRYKLEQMMKLTEKELDGIESDKTQPKFERSLAKAVKDDDWNKIERIINQVYGQPKEQVEHTNPDGNLRPRVEIIDRRQDGKSDTDTGGVRKTS